MTCKYIIFKRNINGFNSFFSEPKKKIDFKNQHDNELKKKLYDESYHLLSSNFIL